MSNSPTFTLYKNSSDVYGTSGVTIYHILNLIKTGDNGIKETVTKLRELLQEGKAEEYKQLKQTLPMFTSAGNFYYRNGSPGSLKDYSPLIALDFDFEDPTVISAFKQYLVDCATTNHLVAVWLSPGHGVKALMWHDNQDPSLHYNLFYSIRKNLFPGVDVNCSDICRTCFLSYDPDIFINEDESITPYEFEYDDSIPSPSVKASSNNGVNFDCTEFFHTQEEIDKNYKFQMKCTDKTILNKLNKMFNKSNPDYWKDGHRHSEVKKRAIIFCKYGILYGTSLWSLKGLFGSNSRSNLNENDIEGMVTACYRNARLEFGSERETFFHSNTDMDTPF